MVFSPSKQKLVVLFLTPFLFAMVAVPSVSANGYGAILDGRVYPSFTMIEILGHESKNQDLLRSEDIPEPFVMAYSPYGEPLNKPILTTPEATKKIPKKKTIKAPKNLSPQKPTLQPVKFSG